MSEEIKMTGASSSTKSAFRHEALQKPNRESTKPKSRFPNTKERNTHIQLPPHNQPHPPLNRPPLRIPRIYKRHNRPTRLHDLRLLVLYPRGLFAALKTNQSTSL